MQQNDSNTPSPEGGPGLGRVLRALAVQLRGLVGNPGIQFLRDLFGLLSAQIVVKIIGFVTFAYLARVLSHEGYGAIEFVLSVVGLGLLFVDFGLGNVGVRLRLRGETDHGLVAEIATIRLFFALCAFPIALATIHFNFEDNAIRHLGLFFALALVLTAWKQEWLLQSLERIGTIARGQVIKAAIFAALVIWLVSRPEDFVWVGASELIATAIWIAFLLYHQRKAGVFWRLSLSPKRMRRLVRQASPLAGTSVIWGMVQYVPPIAVALMAGLESAALLAVAQRIVTSLQTISYSYHFNFYASLIKRLDEGVEALEKLVMASSRVVAWGLIGPAIFCAAHAGDVTALAFGEAYRAAGPVLAILIFGVPIQFLSGHQRWTLMATGRNHLVLTCSTAGALSMFVAVLVLTPVFGPAGAATAVILAASVTWGVAVLFCLRHGIRLNPIAMLLRPTGMAIGLHLLVSWSVNSWWVWQLGLELAAYAASIALADRQFFRDLRHVAYAKKRKAGQVDDVSGDQ